MILELTSERTGKPVEKCDYPNCELCDRYKWGTYCTVPIVVSKQIYRLFADRLEQVEKSLEELEKLVTDEILGEAEQ